MPGRVGKTNEYGAPWGGWDDPTAPRATDDEKTRHNRAALASWLEMRRTGPEGIDMEDDDS